VHVPTSLPLYRKIKDQFTFVICISVALLFREQIPFVPSLKKKKNGYWDVDCNEPDNCIFLLDISVVLVRNFAKTQSNQHVVIGQKFSVLEDILYDSIPSSVIYEFKVSSLSGLQAWDIVDVKCKAVLLPEHDPPRN